MLFSSFLRSYYWYCGIIKINRVAFSTNGTRASHNQQLLDESSNNDYAICLQEGSTNWRIECEDGSLDAAHISTNNWWHPKGTISTCIHLVTTFHWWESSELTKKYICYSIKLTLGSSSQITLCRPLSLLFARRTVIISCRVQIDMLVMERHATATCRDGTPHKLGAMPKSSDALRICIVANMLLCREELRILDMQLEHYINSTKASIRGACLINRDNISETTTC